MENNNKGTGPLNPKPIFWLTREPKNSMQHWNFRLSYVWCPQPTWKWHR